MGTHAQQAQRRFAPRVVASATPAAARARRQDAWTEQERPCQRRSSEYREHANEIPFRWCRGARQLVPLRHNLRPFGVADKPEPQSL
jgi:hypothetical protein